MKAKIFAIWIIFYLGGALLAPFFNLTLEIAVILAFSLFVSSFLIYSRRNAWVLLVGLAFFLLSVGKFIDQTKYYQDLNKKYQGTKNLILTVVDVPTKTEFGQQVLAVNESGTRFKLFLPAFPAYEYADRLKVEGTVKEYDQERAENIIKDKIAGEVSVKKVQKLGKSTDLQVLSKEPLIWFRVKMNESIQKALPSAEAGLASGLILGEKTLISAELKRDLQASGTSHIIALSGYNITIILSLFVIFNRKWSRLLNLLVPFGFIMAFVVMTGAAPSIVRAAIMGFMPIIAKFIGRPGSSFIAILFSAFLMVFLNPYLLLFDVGFQLSFTAMFGLVYLSPLINRFFVKESLLTNIFAETMGAQIAVIPLVMFYFGIVSIVAPLSNLLILSLVPIGMLVSFLVGFSGIFSALLARFVGLSAFVVLKSINQMIFFFGKLPFASVQFKFDNPVWIALIYLALFDFWFLIKKRIPERELSV